ncbi:hypothetical protein ACQ7RL_003952, partial [Photobacterium damselae]
EPLDLQIVALPVNPIILAEPRILRLLGYIPKQVQNADFISKMNESSTLTLLGYIAIKSKGLITG